MSLNPKIWGKHSWIFLHSVTLSYPNNPTPRDKINIKKFFTNIGNVLPCHNCRKNYEEHLKDLPLNNKCLESKESLVKWLLHFHNKVNESTGKQLITYDELINKYSKMYNNNTKNYTFIFITIFSLIVLISIYIFLQKRKL